LLKRIANCVLRAATNRIGGGAVKVPPHQVAQEAPIFPRLDRVLDSISNISRAAYEPTRLGHLDRIRHLEAKVEFLLDENYRAKSLLRLLPEASKVLAQLKDYQISTFDYQWADIMYHDEFLSNPTWRERAAIDAAERAGVSVDWFKDKKILDCGCGPGRHAWVFGSLGASVTAFDLADRALGMARKATAEFPNVTIEKRSITSPLPYPNDFDLVWSYGVLHHTGDTLGALRNISQHVRPGGRIYLMLYAEPRRNNIFDFQYQHEVTTMREATRHLKFREKSAIFERIEGPRHTLAWFDAISSEINDLYTFEEIRTHLSALGFSNIQRTMPHETMHNVIGVRKG
jgi:SAM-dependent methyltransferase